MESKGLDDTLHMQRMNWICAFCTCSKVRFFAWPSQNMGRAMRKYILSISFGHMQTVKIQTGRGLWYSFIYFIPSSDSLTLVLLNKLPHPFLIFSQSDYLIQIHILNGKQCRSRSVGFFRSQLIWIYTVCKGRLYPGSAGLGLRSYRSPGSDCTDVRADLDRHCPHM